MKVFFIVKINKMLKSSKKDINVCSAKVKALQGGHVKVAPRILLINSHDDIS